MKEVKNTLEGFEYTDQRRSGNSTRQINIAIDLLFKGYKVEIKDHWEHGRNRKTNENLFERVLRRLQAEHRLDMLIKENKIKIDGTEFTIELL